MFELNEMHKMTQQMIRQWCDKNLRPNISKLEEGEMLPYDLMRSMMKQFGLDAMSKMALQKRVKKLREQESGAGVEKKNEAPNSAMSELMGEGGGDPMLMMVVVKELSRVSPGFAMSWGVSMGLAGGAIISKGNADQVEKYGIPMATMEKVGSWCLTEPGAGSDAFGSMRSVAKPDGDYYVLNGQKTFITNGPCADVFVVYAKIDRGQPVAEMPVNTFILEKGMPGFTQGKPFKKMGMRDSPTSELFFEDVRVPKANLLGGKEKTAEGRADTKESLGNERSGIPAMALGIIEECYERSVKYVQERKQFGRVVGEFQAVQLDIADMYVKLKNVENIVYRTAWMQKKGIRDVSFINASKAYCSQACVDVALKAIQLHGGYGYMEEYHIEKLARDSKLLELGAGTTHINYLTAARNELGLGK
ncbi:MAG: acyl-CoA dehydrogenase family protein [Deltaproteobacteria bacterium]|nr:acyl-CoA dehydrogenase family protein [Deltaproteobacteria bacterium]